MQRVVAGRQRLFSLTALNCVNKKGRPKAALVHARGVKSIRSGA